MSRAVFSIIKINRGYGFSEEMKLKSRSGTSQNMSLYVILQDPERDLKFYFFKSHVFVLCFYWKKCSFQDLVPCSPQKKHTHRMLYNFASSRPITLVFTHEPRYINKFLWKKKKLGRTPQNKPPFPRFFKKIGNTKNKFFSSWQKFRVGTSYLWYSMINHD